MVFSFAPLRRALWGIGLTMAVVGTSGVSISQESMAKTVVNPAKKPTNSIVSPGTVSPNSPIPKAEVSTPERTIQLQQSGEIPFLLWLFGGTILMFVFLPQLGWIMGLIVVNEREVGIVIKKFSFKQGLAAGHLIALNGEAGYQADVLAPGWHFGYFPWQYNVKREPVIIVPQGEIGLVVANDGRSIPAERILGKTVPCDNFQDARKFLLNGGEKGRQLGILTAGTYRVNSALFSVITSTNATQFGMKPSELRIYKVDPEKVGIVTTLDGVPISEGEIAGPIIPDHDNFQNAQSFISQGGRRGLQEQVVLSGSWNLNPWFAQVEQVPMSTVPIGYVGVVISFVGASNTDVSGESFTHGHLVSVGNKGVWVEPLYPGKHPLNTHIMKVELVPTTNIVLNFSDRTEEHGYDAKLRSLNVRSIDGFAFRLEVAQIIHVGALDAPKVISRVGSMQNLVDHVMRPIVGNYFRNSAQAYTVLDFLIARSERQVEAADYIRTALRAYDVQAVDTLIGQIEPPEELMQTLIDRKIAQEQEKTYEVQRLAQTQRQELVRETSLADIQQQVVKAEQGVKIAELESNARINAANGEAEAVRLMGQAKAEAYRSGVQALGPQAYTALQLMQVIGDHNVRVVSDVSVSGGGHGNGLMDALLGMVMVEQKQRGSVTAALGAMTQPPRPEDRPPSPPSAPSAKAPKA